MLKVKYLDQARIFRLPDQHLSFHQLQTMALNSFSRLSLPFYFEEINPTSNSVPIKTSQALHSILQAARSNHKSKCQTMVRLTVKEATDELFSLDHSFEVLQEDDSILEILEDEEIEEGEENEGESKKEITGQDNLRIIDLVRGHLEILERECIEKVFSVNKFQEDQQVSNFLSCLYQEISREVYPDSSAEQESQLLAMIEQSLAKLLPNFIKRVTDAAVAQAMALL